MIVSVIVDVIFEVEARKHTTQECERERIDSRKYILMGNEEYREGVCPKTFGILKELVGHACGL